MNNLPLPKRPKLPSPPPRDFHPAFVEKEHWLETGCFYAAIVLLPILGVAYLIFIASLEHR